MILNGYRECKKLS